MSADPVKLVVAYLTQHGHKELPNPVVISGVRFSFPAVLAGPERSSDLVIVLDTANEPDNGILLRQVLAVARALDIARHKNPLTTVIVGPRPSSEVLAEMMSVSRVLPIGALPTREANKILANWLAVLTPLGSIQLVGKEIDPLGEVRKRAGAIRQDVTAILGEAPAGQKRVAAAFDALLAADIASVTDGDE